MPADANRTTTNQHKLLHIILFLFAILAFFAIAIFIVRGVGYHIQLFHQRQLDFEQLSSDDYEIVFLSTYPIDSYEESDFEYYLGQKTCKLNTTIPDISTLKKYITFIATNMSQVKTIYLGISPDRISAKSLASLIQEHPDVMFEIIPDYPSIQSWDVLSDKACSQKINRYAEICTALVAVENCQVYAGFSQKWLIANPGNYLASRDINSDAAQLFLTDMCGLQKTLLTEDNINQQLDFFVNIIEQSREAPISYPDFSHKSIVFFGDSIIGNYDGSTSIPGVVTGLTGAHTYNLAIGGTCASDTNDGRVSLSQAVNAFLAKDSSLLPKQHPSATYLNQYIADSPDDSAITFVLNYGLNDYFEGMPIGDVHSTDTATYMGAIREAILSIRESYPNATILLNCPSFSIRNNGGTDITSNEGGILTDYVNAIYTLGNELNTLVLDNYSALGINADNYANYLVDDTHPNADTRFQIAQLIIEKIQ